MHRGGLHVYAISDEPTHSNIHFLLTGYMKWTLIQYNISVTTSAWTIHKSSSRIFRHKTVEEPTDSHAVLRMRPYAVRDSLRWSPAATSVFVGSNNRRDSGTAICLASVNSAQCVRDFDVVVEFVYGESWLRGPSVGWRSVQDCHGRRVIATYVGVPCRATPKGYLRQMGT